MFVLLDKLAFRRLNPVGYDVLSFGHTDAYTSQIFDEEISSYVTENVNLWFYCFFLCLSDHYIKRILNSLNELVSILLQEVTNF